MSSVPGHGPGSVRRAVYPGTFDPFTPGHFDVVDRARRMFDGITVLVAVNGGKRPSRPGAARAARIARSLPADWADVSVAAWEGLTADYCRQHGIGVIVRGIRSAADWPHEHHLAAMNEALGVATVFVPARSRLAAVSSTVVRALASPAGSTHTGSTW